MTASTHGGSDKVLQTISRHGVNDAIDSVRALGGLTSLLAACLIEAGGSIDLSYEAMGQAALVDIEVVRRADDLGVTVRVRNASEATP